MTTKRDPWVRVKSEDELRAGMAILWLRPYGGSDVEVITKRIVTDGNSPCSPERAFCPSRLRWFSTGCFESEGFNPFCFYEFIEAGEIYRLADDQLADLSETRELETAR